MAHYGGSPDDLSPLHLDNTLNQDATEFHFTVSNATVDRGKFNVEVYATPIKNPDVLSFDGLNAYANAIIEIKESIIKEEGGAVTFTDVLNELKQKAKDDFAIAHSTGYTINDLTLTEMKRTINIDISDNGVSQTVTKEIKYACKATISYTYVGTGAGAAPTTGTYEPADTVTVYDVEFDDGAGGTTTTCTVYDNSGTIAGTDANGKHYKLNNVYLYYFPAFESIYGADCEDEINITGNLTDIYEGGTDQKDYGTEPLNFFIARQTPTSLSDSLLNIDDHAYNYSVNCSLTGAGNCYLLHNFGEAIKNDFDYDLPYSSHITGFSDMKKIDEGIVEKTNLIYELKVEVYDADTGKQVAEFTGTKNE